MSLTEPTNAEQVRSKFFAEVQQQLGFSPERIREILGKQFNGFNARRLSDYWVVLRGYRAIEIQKEEDILEQRVAIPYPPCPRCGAPTVGDLSSYGRYTKTPGWRCTQGGLRHFLEWKANQILRHQGKQPVYTEVTGERGDGVDYDLVWRIVAKLDDVETRLAYAAVLVCLKATAPTTGVDLALVARAGQLLAEDTSYANQ